MTAFMAGALIVLEVRGPGSFPFDEIVSYITIVGIAVLGAIIQGRDPGNRVGALLQVVAFFFMVSGLGAAHPDGVIADPDVWDYIAPIAESLGLFAIMAIFWILFVFPDGRFLNRAWMLIGLGIASVFILIFLVTVFSTEIGEVWNDDPYLANPIGFVPWEVTRFATQFAAFMFLTMGITGVLSVGMRFRRSSGVVRTQVKWVLYASVVMLLSLPVAFSSDPMLEAVFFSTLIGSLPVAMTVAITRYKLFEINRLISRTISYGIVAIVLAGAFFGLVVLVTSFFDSQNNLAIAAATLAVAALFNPLRKRVQLLVDRKFNRSSYQARLVAEDFAHRLRQPHSAEEVAAMLNETVDDTLQPSLSAVWLRHEGSVR